MGDADRLQALEWEVARLRRENRELAREADNALHLPILAEKLALQPSVDDLIVTAIESIATFKAMPYCAYLRAKGEALMVQQEFFLEDGAEPLLGRSIVLPRALDERLEQLHAYVDLTQPTPELDIMLPPSLREQLKDGYLLPVYQGAQRHGVV